MHDIHCKFKYFKIKYTARNSSEPCIPEHISTQYSLSIGQVLWDMTAGAEHYTVEAVTEQGVTVSCATNDTYCALYSMVCGQVYSINVTASNHVCQDVSTSTQSVAIMTGEEEETSGDGKI